MYDFETIIDRRGTGSEKWNVAPGELPMWVADMDFRTAPEIVHAVAAKAKSGIYGYEAVGSEFAKVVARWWYRRHAWDVDPAWVSYCIGIVPAISSLVRTFTKTRGKVLVQAPVYHIFYHCIENSGRQVVTNDLQYKNGRYSIDWQDLAAKLADPAVTLFILCNPQNPTGTIWNKDDLARMGSLAADNGVVVIADEIHCDLTDPGTRYTPFASLGEICANNSITLVSPTKTFNLPGLKTSAMIVSNATLRERAQRGLNRDEISEPNSFAITAAIAAFRDGEPWLEELRVHIHRNRERLTQYINTEIPDLSVVAAQSTYLPWVDCSRLTEDTTQFCQFLRARTGLYISQGAQFGSNGKAFVRINIACPRQTLEDGMARLKRGVLMWKAREV